MTYDKRNEFLNKIIELTKKERIVWLYNGEEYFSEELIVKKEYNKYEEEMSYEFCLKGFATNFTLKCIESKHDIRRGRRLIYSITSYFDSNEFSTPILDILQMAIADQITNRDIKNKNDMIDNFLSYNNIY